MEGGEGRGDRGLVEGRGKVKWVMVDAGWKGREGEIAHMWKGEERWNGTMMERNGIAGIMDLRMGRREHGMVDLLVKGREGKG